MKEKIIGVILAWIICMFLSWIITCGLILVVCKCFSLAYSWKIATGIWVLFLLARWIISAAKSNRG